MLTKNQEKAVKMLATGRYLQKEIAKEIKVTEQTVTSWKKNPEFIATYEKELDKNLKYLAHKAYNTMGELLDASSENVRFSAAKDILDRTGFKAVDKIEVKEKVVNPYENLTEGELRKLAKDG